MDKYFSQSFDDKALLNLEEMCYYLGIGKTKAREILNDPNCSFRFSIGNRVYANKVKLDQRLATHDTIV